MLTRTILAALAAVAVTGPALATCLEDRVGAQCDIFLDRYRADEVPVGATMVWPGQEFVVENFEAPGLQRPAYDRFSDDVLYWDGEKAFVVPDVSGPPIEILSF